MRIRIRGITDLSIGTAFLAVIVLALTSGCSREPEYVPLDASSSTSPHENPEDNPMAETPPPPENPAKSEDPVGNPATDPVDEKDLMAALRDQGIQIPTDGDSLPENFPKDVPVPKGGKTGIYVSEPLNVLFKVPDQFPTVLNRYRSALENEGWVLENRCEGKSQSTNLSFRKGNRTLKAEIAGETEGSSVSLDLGAALLPSPGRD